MKLAPDTTITPADRARGERALVQDAAWASLAGALYGGVIQVGFALALGAGPFIIGLLAAIPLMAQATQLPAIALVEHVRQRRKIAVIAVTAARILILSLALLPFLDIGDVRLTWLLIAQVAICVLGSVGGCSVNSWLHQFLPREGLGSFFARRLFWGTSLACAGSLATGLLVDHWTFGPRLHAYAVAFALAGLAGLVSSWFLAHVPEPVMVDGGPAVTIRSRIVAPFRDRPFRSMLLYIAAWNAASNLAAPFLAVYLMQQLGLSLGTVTTLWVTSQVANAMTLYLWGRLSDRLSNKAILAVALPVYFACVLGLVFAAVPHNAAIVLAALYAVHFVMGAAGGGISLATGNMGLKLAPHGQGTAYLAAISLVASITGGLVPILGGSLAHWFEAAQLSVLVRWGLPGTSGEVSVLAFARWQFLFAISFLLGFYVMHALSRIREGEEISERVVMQHFALEALRTVNQVSSVAGLLGNLFSFGRLRERRMTARRSDAGARESERRAAPAG